MLLRSRRLIAAVGAACARVEGGQIRGDRGRLEEARFWLKAANVRMAIASGEPEGFRASADRLALETQLSRPDLDVARARIVELVRDESLRRMADGDGCVTKRTSRDTRSALD